MTDLEKPKRKPRAKKKPPPQTAGVIGIDGHGGMGEAPTELPTEPRIDWFKLINLPAFQMFVAEQSGLTYGVTMSNWVAARRATLSDSVLYDQYAAWHKAQGLWIGESPMGEVI